jgi:hypothetical protein
VYPFIHYGAGGRAGAIICDQHLVRPGRDVRREAGENGLKRGGVVVGAEDEGEAQGKRMKEEG